jgi:hypothetical protein
MAQKPRKHSLDAANDTASLAGLTEAIRALLTIEGVEGVGQPVMLLSLADLPPDFLGFVERLRGGCIEDDEEMLVITLAGSTRPHRGKETVLARLRQAVTLLSRHARDKGATPGDVIALLDEVKRGLSWRTRKPKGR